MEHNFLPSLEEQNRIFHLYTKYRYYSYNKILSSNEQILKFKDKINNYERIFKEIQKHKFKQAKPNEIQIFIKDEKKEKKVFNESSNPLNETQSTEKTSETTIKEKENDNNNNNNNNNNNKNKIEKENDKKKNRKFLVLGGYPDIINALLNRGWEQIKDETDRSYDLIYTLKSADIPFNDLKPQQISGHFWKANEITRKAGLNNNIRNLYFKGICIENFFPRAYELSEKNDLQDFMEDFKTTKALSILKEAVLVKKGKNVNKKIVETCLDIIKRKIPVFTEIFDVKEKFEKVVKGKFYNDKNKNNNNEEDQKNYEIKLITDEEWEIIGNENMDKYYEYTNKLIKQRLIEDKNKKNNLNNAKDKKNISNKNIKKVASNTMNKKKNDNNVKKETNINEMTEDEKKMLEEIKKELKEKDIQREKEKQKLNEEILKEEMKRRELELLKEENEQNNNNIQTEEELKEEQEEKKPLTKEEIEKKWQEETFIKISPSHERPPLPPQTDNLSEELINEITSTLNKIKPFLPEYNMEGYKNVWIVKPGGLSRGRGIHCIDQLNDILANIKKCGQTVIQKYIENPLVIQNRKFDIRQWVLVTDLSPLTIWMFDTPYIRFSAEDYNIDDFKNIFSQLTNNSIAKHSEKFNETNIEGDMWELEQFKKYLVENYGKDYWPEIQEKIKKCVIYSLESAKHKIFQRKNTIEVFGYDIMIDENLNVYLIEINASPDWSYSTKVTEKLVKIASDDIIKVIIDYNDEMKKKENERNNNIDTGRFKLVFKGNDFPKFDNMIVNDKDVKHI